MEKLAKPFSSWTTYDDHAGVDFPYGRGSAIRASGSGVVRYRGWNQRKASGDAHSPGQKAGNAVIVAYDNGVELRYCHLDSLDSAPAPGTRVSEGDYLGPVGTTGLSTGNHLHLEVWVNGGIRKGAAFWEYVDKARTVGDAKPASGGGQPFPIVEDEMTEDDFNRIQGMITEAVVKVQKSTQNQLEARMTRIQKMVTEAVIKVQKSTQNQLEGRISRIAKAVWGAKPAVGSTVSVDAGSQDTKKL